MIVFALVLGAQLDVNLTAIGGLVGILVTAYVSGRMLGPNRRKVIEETATTATTRATAALEVALTHYESDNERLRGEVDELEQRIDGCLERLAAVKTERDQLASRIARLSEQLTAAGIAPAH